MKSHIVAIGWWLFIAMVCACGDDSSPTTDADAGLDAGDRKADTSDDFKSSGGSGAAPDKLGIGGEVSGLSGSGLVLELNDDDQLEVEASGPFTFQTKLARGTDYRVSIESQPSNPRQKCEVTKGSGKVEESNIDSVRIACSDIKSSIGGSVTGLGGGEIKLQNNGGDDLTVNANGDFTFKTPLAPGASYDVTIAAAPPGRLCSLAKNQGTTNGVEVSDIEIACYAELTLHARARVKSVELTWNDSGAMSYNVYRSTDKDCSFDAPDSCPGAGKMENVKSPYFWLEGFDNGTVYYFHVRGSDAGSLTSKSGQPAPGARPNGPELDKQVRAISTGANNTVYVGGDFSAVGPYTGPVAPIDKTTGFSSRMPNFPIIPGSSSAVRSVAADGSGGYFVGGFFTLVIDGGTRRNLVHVRADGTLDTTWNPGVNGPVWGLALVGDRLYLAGGFQVVGGAERLGLASVSATGAGALDASWNPKPTPYQNIRSIVASASAVYVTGAFTEFNGVSRARLAKLSTTNGALEDFPTPDGAVSALALSDDVLYVAGAFSNIGGVTRSRLAAIKQSDGQVQANPQLGDNASEPAPNALAVSGDLLYLGGNFTTITIGSTTEPRVRLAALDRHTGALADWKPEANANVQVLAASGDTIYVAGDFTAIGTSTHRHLAGIGTNGSLREDWAPQPGAPISGIAVDAESVFAFGLDVRSFGVDLRGHLAAFRDGALTPWGPEVSGGTVHALAAAAETIFVAGDFDMVGGNARAGAAAVSDASAVRDWNAQLSKNSGAKPIVRALGVGDHRIYLGGDFTRSAGDDARNNLVALASDNAALPDTWTISGANGEVRAIAVDGADNVFIGGAFDVVGPAATHTRLAKLSADTGAPDGAWSPSANDAVQALIVLGDNLFVGGAFTELGGAARTHLGALATTSSGSLNSWNPDLNGTVYALASDGQALYAVGDFTSYGQSFAAIDTEKNDFPRASGALDVAAFGPIYAVAADSGHVYIGGDSRSVAAAVGGTSRCWFYCEHAKPTLPP